MAADTEQGPLEPPLQGPTTVMHAPIRSGPDGDLVWRHLKATWLTHHFVSDAETHVKGGYAWDASNYLPVLTLDAEGQPVLGFARSSQG